MARFPLSFVDGNTQFVEFLNPREDDAGTTRVTPLFLRVWHSYQEYLALQESSSLPEVVSISGSVEYVTGLVSLIACSSFYGSGRKDPRIVLDVKGLGTHPIEELISTIKKGFACLSLGGTPFEIRGADSLKQTSNTVSFNETPETQFETDPLFEATVEEVSVLMMDAEKDEERQCFKLGRHSKGIPSLNDWHYLFTYTLPHYLKGNEDYLLLVEYLDSLSISYERMGDKSFYEEVLKPSYQTLAPLIKKEHERWLFRSLIFENPRKLALKMSKTDFYGPVENMFEHYFSLPNDGKKFAYDTFFYDVMGILSAHRALRKINR